MDNSNSVIAQLESDLLREKTLRSALKKSGSDPVECEKRIMEIKRSMNDHKLKTMGINF